MRSNSLLLRCAAPALLVLFAIGSIVRADAITGSYGDVSVVGPDWKLTSSATVGTGVGYAGVYEAYSGSITPNDLTHLSAAYQMLLGTFGGGAPRFSIIDTTNNNNNEAYVYWGTPTGGGSFSDPATGNTGDYVGGADVRVYNNGFGGVGNGNTGQTWAQFLADVGTVPIGYITVDLDGGWSQNGGTQQMLLSNVQINNQNFAPAIVPTPKTVWAGLSLFVCLIGARGIKRFRREELMA